MDVRRVGFALATCLVVLAGTAVTAAAAPPGAPPLSTCSAALFDGDRRLGPEALPVRGGVGRALRIPVDPAAEPREHAARAVQLPRVPGGAAVHGGHGSDRALVRPAGRGPAVPAGRQPGPGRPDPAERDVAREQRLPGPAEL